MSPFGSKVREEDFIKSQKNRVIRFDFQRRFCISSLRYRERTRKREREGEGGGPRWLMAVTVARQLLLLAPFFFPKGQKARVAPWKVNVEGAGIGARDRHTRIHTHTHTHTSLIVESCDSWEGGGLFHIKRNRVLRKSNDVVLRSFGV